MTDLPHSTTGYKVGSVPSEVAILQKPVPFSQENMQLMEHKGAALLPQLKDVSERTREAEHDAAQPLQQMKVPAQMLFTLDHPCVLESWNKARAQL